jgi:peptidoglycan hydrolase-like protein with peptidoglycan-binding domain
MSKITIYESVGNTSQLVTDYRSLENHHPSRKLQESGRVYARVGGEPEEILGNYRGTAVLTPGGEYMVSKDMVITAPGLRNDQVPIPSPASGVIGKIDRDDGVITINDPKTGDTMFQIRHAKIDPNLKPGDKVEYGQPIGLQHGYNNGNPNAFGDHVHFDVNTRYIAQADKWIKDMHAGTITTDRRPPGPVENIVTERPTFVPISGNFPKQADPPLADGKLSFGEFGPEVEKLQRALNAAGARDAKGNQLDPDKDFGERTREAVQNYERMKGRPVTGVASREMLIELGVISPTQQQKPTEQKPVEQPKPTEQPKPAAQTNPYGYGPDNPLGRLIGSGEGGYNSFNRGVAGDARGAQIDFSQMTVGEVMRRQDLPRGNPDRLFAVGKYQFTPDTLEETVKALGIDRNAKFTPQLQEKMFADYLIDEKRPAVKAYITGKTGGATGLDNAQHALAQEFASVGTPRKGGRGVYDGDSGGNLASISPAQTERVLNQMREQYQKNVQAGMNPDAAYRALSGDPNKYSRDSGAVGQGQSQNQTRSGGLEDTLLTKGERGEGVLRLQRALNEAGIRDDQGRKLPETGNFLDLTEAAVRKYQAKMGLQVDGDAGEQTLKALGIHPGQQKTAPVEKPVEKPAEKPADQKPADQKPNTGTTDQPPASDSRTSPQPQGNKPTIADPSHPDHRLYAQALSNLEQLGPGGGFKSREEMERAAAAVAADAKASGFTEINHVSRATAQTGQTLLIAVQGDPTSPASKNAYIDYNQATSQSIEQSTRMAEAAGARQNTQPQPDQQQNQTQQPDPIRLAAAR